MSNHNKTRIDLGTDERFEIWGKRISTLTFEDKRGEVTYDTNVALRTSANEYVGTVRVGQSVEAANVANGFRRLMVGTR